jgi:hypothetical protein
MLSVRMVQVTTVTSPVVATVTVDDAAVVQRPRLADAPTTVRAAVEELLGGPVVAERAAAAGFTPSVASIVVGSGGNRLFVKAAPVGEGLGEAVRAGVALAEVVAELAPRLVGSARVGQWRVAAYEVAIPLLAELERGGSRPLPVARPCTTGPPAGQRLRQPDGRLRIVDWTQLSTAPQRRTQRQRGLRTLRWLESRLARARRR